MNRRGFLQSCIALAAAPAIVRADSLMRIVPRDTTILTPAMYDMSGNGNHLYWSADGKHIGQIIVFDRAHDEATMSKIASYLEGRLHADEIAAMAPVAWYRA